MTNRNKKINKKINKMICVINAGIKAEQQSKLRIFNLLKDDNKVLLNKFHDSSNDLINLGLSVISKMNDMRHHQSLTEIVPV